MSPSRSLWPSGSCTSALNRKRSQKSQRSRFVSFPASPCWDPDAREFTYVLNTVGWNMNLNRTVKRRRKLKHHPRPWSWLYISWCKSQINTYGISYWLCVCSWKRVPETPGGDRNLIITKKTSAIMRKWLISTRKLARYYEKTSYVKRPYYEKSISFLQKKILLLGENVSLLQENHITREHGRLVMIAKYEGSSKLLHLWGVFYVLTNPLVFSERSEAFILKTKAAF